MAEIDVFRKGVGAICASRSSRPELGACAGSIMIRPPSSRTSTAWLMRSEAADITEAGIRTEALLPHFLT
jgi:hypothetical protein